MKVVMVRWLDAWMDTRRFDAEDAAGFRPYQAVAVGLLVRQDEVGVVLAMEAFLNEATGDLHYCGAVFIPKGCVVSVEVLEDGEA